MAAHLAGNSAPQADIVAAFELFRLGPHVLASLLQSWTVQLGRISDLLLELDMLRLAFPLLSSVECPPGAIKLTFLHLALECKFVVVLLLGELGVLLRCSYSG